MNRDLEQESARDIERISSLEQQVAAEINELLGGEYVDGEGRIISTHYSDVNGGPIEAAIVKRDTEMVQGNEASWFGIYDDDQRGFLAAQYGVSTIDKSPDSQIAELITHLPEMREQRRQADGAVAETIAWVTLQRSLGPDFIVVKTNAADDERGVDLLIIDKQTGQPFGVIDVVTDRVGGSRAGGKYKKVQEKNQRGGALIRYGLKAVGDQLTRATLEHVPTFAYEVDKDSLDEQLAGLMYMNDISPEVIRPMIESMTSQARSYLEDEKIGDTSNV
jgi:hypothetical protein